MGIGLVSISTTQKREATAPPGPPGPPFASDSADNGLSVDATTGRIVLGNDQGDVAQPAGLLSSREIVVTDINGNSYTLTLLTSQGMAYTEFSGNRVLIDGPNGETVEQQVSSGDNGIAQVTIVAGDSGTAFLNVVAGTNGTAAMNLATGPDGFMVFPTGFGEIVFRAGGIQVWGIDLATFFTQIGPTLTSYNGATLQVTGTFTKRYLPQSTGVDLAVNRDTDSGKIFRNSGAVTFTLPNMIGANDRPGFHCIFAVFNAGGITVEASAGQTIRIGSLSSTSGGTVASTEVGAVIRITLIDSSTWFTEYFTGAWSLT